MKVIAEFADIRNGKRYGPGDGDKISPALTEEQVARLTKAGCILPDKKEDKTTLIAREKQELTGRPLESFSRAELETFAKKNKIDISTAKNKTEIVALLVAANAANAKAAV